MKKKEIISKSTYEEYKSIVDGKNALLKKINTVLACVCAVSFIPAIVIINSTGSGLGFIAVGITIGILLIVNAVIGFRYAKYVNAVEEYENAQEAEKKRIEEKLRKQQEANAQDIMTKLDEIKKTVIVETHTGKDNADTMNRGVVGALLFGATGAIVGTATAEEKTYTTFLIIFNDDTRTTQSVENGSTLYNHFIKFLEV